MCSPPPSAPALRTVVVEDHALLALELEAHLADLGHHVVGVAADAASASPYVHDQQVELALIDVNLRDGPTGPLIADAFRRRGVAVVFVTANPEQIRSEEWATVVAKPYHLDALARAIGHVAERRRG